MNHELSIARTTARFYTEGIVGTLSAMNAFARIARPIRTAILCTASLVVAASPVAAHAATLFVTPAEGQFDVGQTFDVIVRVDTKKSVINASEGTLSFNPAYLQVQSIRTTGSIFNLNVQEPEYSNTAGTIRWTGVILNPGYAGTAGNLITVRFQSRQSGTTWVNFSSGAVLANDGSGTNVLTGMIGGVYTVRPVDTPSVSPTASPSPELTLWPPVSPPTMPSPPLSGSSLWSWLRTLPPWIGMVCAAVIVWLLLLFLGRVFRFPKPKTRAYQAVFLTNGLAYVGRLRRHSFAYLRLDDVHFLIADPKSQTPLEAVRALKSQLIALGDDVLASQGSMYISKRQILFWEDLAPTSRIVRAIQAPPNPPPAF